MQQRFHDPALAATYAHYRAVLDARDAQLEAIEADLAGWYDAPPFADAVHRLSASRGVTRLGALTLASEVGDWRRFAQAAAFAGFCGLVPSELLQRQLDPAGHITTAGNAHLRAQLARVGLVYQHRPGVGSTCVRASRGWTPRSSRGRGRRSLGLCGRFQRLAARKDSKNVVVTAIARELAGFLWAELLAA